MMLTDFSQTLCVFGSPFAIAFEGAGGGGGEGAARRRLRVAFGMNRAGARRVGLPGGSRTRPAARTGRVGPLAPFSRGLRR